MCALLSRCGGVLVYTNGNKDVKMIYKERKRVHSTYVLFLATVSDHVILTMT